MKLEKKEKEMLDLLEELEQKFNDVKIHRCTNCDFISFTLEECPICEGKMILEFYFSSD